MANDDRQSASLGPDALRSSFGDRIPEISRKITACVACRKQKIKCHMPDSGSPCSRCKKRGLPCAVNRSLQMLLEDNATWKNKVTQKIETIEAFMDTVRDKLAIPSPSQDAPMPDGDASAPSASQQTTPEAHRQGWEVRMDADSGPAAVPASVVSEVNGTNQAQTTPQRPGDLISDSVITLSQARTLFAIYHDRLDHFLYRILGDPTDLARVRAQSPLLLAAICTVASLHSPRHAALFERCYAQLTHLASRASLSQRTTLADIRGLLIGAFWLHDLSWPLVSMAVRAATQNHYHRSFQRALDGDRTAYAQTRLWYHVYVCDHHFSVAYGRPPLTHEGDAVRQTRQFLQQCRHADEFDARLVSQVDIWALASRTLDDFGFGVDVPVAAGAVPRLRRYMIALDTWRADWNERFAPNAFVGEYPRKGVGLHFHFAKLYLCAHAFRGLALGPPTRPPERRNDTSSTPTSSSSPRLDAELEEIASVAVHSAKSILRIIINDTEIQSHLHGLSLYFDTMIVFAVVFLLKVATQYGDTVPIDAHDTLALVGEMSGVLNSVAASMHPQHLLVAIARGVETILERCRAGIIDASGATAAAVGQEAGGGGGVQQLQEQQQQHQLVDATQAVPSSDWMNMLGDQQDLGFDWTNYDFLANQDAFTSGGSDVFGTGFM